jgi:hypothetical protein
LRTTANFPFPTHLPMRTPITLAALVAALPIILPAQTALTVYNQNFAVVRESVALELQAGTNAVTFDRATLQVEPDSVVLRDPSGKIDLRILEQSYRAETASQGLLLSLNEGKEIDFLSGRNEQGEQRIVRGKVIRAGSAEFHQRGQWNAGPGGTPIIEVDGQLRFSLPGEPLFPALADDAVLRPTLSWQLHSDRKAKLNAELGYITGGLSWQSAYNLVSPEKGDTLDIVGWITIDNQSGKTFDDAKIKLMAGDVNKVQPPLGQLAARAMQMDHFAPPPTPAPVTQKAFDEFHLYSLPRAVTLRNRETKQVEFLRATGVKAKTIYVYNGADIAQFRGWNDDAVRNNREYGTQSNSKVGVYREFKNTKENGLGLPLPKGRTRFYRQDDADKGIEFTGENTIDHTAEGETVRIYTGDSFDLVGERKRTDYKLSNANDEMEEAFEIKVRNRKKEPVEIRVTETLYRWVNWQIVEKSDDFEKVDSRNIEFRVTLAPDEEKVITYRVRYDWR